MKRYFILLILLVGCGSGSGGSSSNTQIILAPTINISSSVSEVEINTSFMLSWNTLYANSCESRGDWDAIIGTSGSVMISESTPGTKTYEIFCSGDGGNSSSSVSVNILETIYSPTASIAASKTSVLVNEEFILTWQSSYADSCISIGSWNQSISTAGFLTLSESSSGTKTYGVECSGNGGTVSSSVTVNIKESNSDTAFYGSVIDGYISGAEVFIDQNYNFVKDDGEFEAITDSNGSFVIETNDQSIFNCLKNRPIVANIPVGAIDSTLGGVTEAYQMILPSINDSGTSSIVISPFTTLLTESILLAKDDLVEELTLSEGCSQPGDQVSVKVTQRINEIRQSIETNFGITYDDLTGDFIEISGEKVNESTAQNIAKLFPYLQIIDSEISSDLSSKFEKTIRANVALSEASLDIIFNNESYESLPLDFRSSYKTNENDSGWYQDEVIEASGAYISQEGLLSRKDCSETDTQLCNISELTLKNISNASTSYEQYSIFNKQNIDFDEIGINDGSLSVQAKDSRTWRNSSANWQEKNNRDRECQVNNEIQFQNTVISGTQSNFHYSSYSQGYEKADCDLVRHYYYPILRVSTIVDQSLNDNSLGLAYYIPDILRSGISSNFPYDFISNRVDIDPLLVVKDIAALPRTLNEIDTIRRMFNGEDYVLYEYNKDGQLDSYFEIGSNPRNDMFWDISSGILNNDERLYGQSARDAFYERILSEPSFNDEIYGNSSPRNDYILGRIANSYIEIIDYEGNQEIPIKAYPTYIAESKTLDFSLGGSTLNLSNIQNFVANGIDGKPVSVKIWYNPDDSIAGTIPVKLYLFEGSDTNVDEGEGYFSIVFELEVSSSEGEADNPISRKAVQEWKFKPSATLDVSYTEDDISISKTIINSDLDRIILEDGSSTSDLNESLILEPSSLDTKILSLISSISDNIDGIQSFFKNNEEYTLLMDIGSGDHAIIGFYRNTVERITATFTVSDNPVYSISVDDIRVNEGSSKELCFSRPNSGNLPETSFNLSFNEVERPGKGALVDDFSLSSSQVNFSSGDTISCINFIAHEDTHFDWVHDVYLDISNPTNNQTLSRSKVKISILDSYGYQNRISWKAR